MISINFNFMKSFDKFYSLFQITLQNLYTEPKEIESLFFLLMTHIFKCDKTTVLLQLIEKKKSIF